MIIINADDWGRSHRETDAAFECFQRGRITSASAMVFMEDSERAAELAVRSGIEVGLHLNLTEKFSKPPSDPTVSTNHRRVARFLGLSKFAPIIYYPWLRSEFRQIWNVQVMEFQRLYGRLPSRVDGHQHMHLSTNVLLEEIIPRGMKLRRSFSFWPGEKPFANRIYRAWVDARLTRRYLLTDYFFCLGQGIKTGRLPRVFDLAKTAIVEMMTHPTRAIEHDYLMSNSMADSLRVLTAGTYSQI